jgi:hypothetical protein
MKCHGADVMIFIAFTISAVASSGFLGYEIGHVRAHKVQFTWIEEMGAHSHAHAKLETRRLRKQGIFFTKTYRPYRYALD